MQNRIDPNKLRTERELRSWTQQQLADRAEISLRQIASLEKRKPDGTGHPARESTLNKLVGALGVSSEAIVLSGGEGWTGITQTVPFPVSSIDQLKFDLIEKRYGVSMVELFHNGPMLFVLAAKMSLGWRQHQQVQAQSHLEGLETAMGYTLTYDQRSIIASLKDGLANEAKAIERGEVFTRSQDEIGGSNRFLDWVDAVSGDRGELELIGLRKVDIGGVGLHVPHNVCQKTLYDIAGGLDEDGSNRAIYALAMGEVRLRDIPKELQGAEKRAERIAWLGDHVDGPEEEDWCIDTYPGLHPETAHYSTRFGRNDEEYEK